MAVCHTSEPYLKRAVSAVARRPHLRTYPTARALRSRHDGRRPGPYRRAAGPPVPQDGSPGGGGDSGFDFADAERIEGVFEGRLDDGAFTEPRLRSEET